MSEPAVAAAPRRMSYEQYVAWEQTQDERHEFHDGEVLAMSGASHDHGCVAANCIGELHQRLKGRPCRISDGATRVRQLQARRYVYPDLSIVCEQPQYDTTNPRRLTLLNPLLVLEVLSPSTEAYDRGDKFQYYRQIPSLREYVLVAQDRANVEVFSLNDGGLWAIAAYVGLDAVAKLRSIEVDLPLAEVYANVPLPTPAEDAEDAEEAEPGEAATA